MKKEKRSVEEQVAELTAAQKKKLVVTGIVSMAVYILVVLPLLLAFILFSALMIIFMFGFIPDMAAKIFFIVGYAAFVVVIFAIILGNYFISKAVCPYYSDGIFWYILKNRKKN